MNDGDKKPANRMGPTGSAAALRWLCGLTFLFALHLNATAVLAARVFGPEENISGDVCPECMAGLPAVAANEKQQEFMVAWHNTFPGGQHHIWVRRLSRTGELLGWAAVSTGSWKRYDPALAFNPTNGEYLIVWRYDALNDDSHYEIWGRRVAWDGTGLGPEFQILAWSNRSYMQPRVVWNGTHKEYLVVASVYDTQNQRWNDVAGRRVLADGSTPSPGGPIFQDPALLPQQADVAYNPGADEYLVVWRQKYTDTDRDIWGSRLRGNNASVITPPGAFFINRAAADQANPAVTANQQGRYLVVWEYAGGTATTRWDIHGQELDAHALGVGAELIVAASGDIEYLPAVAMNGITDERIVAWEKTSQSAVLEIWTTLWTGSNPTVLSSHRISDFDTGGLPPFGHKAVAVGNWGILFVYNKIDNSVYHILGRLLWPEGFYLPLLMR